jgi:hypothetical protein
MGQLRKSVDVHKAMVVGVLCLYLAVACGVNLFHTEDDPLTTGKTAPSSDSCPACKFLAGANATQVLYESCPVAIEYQVVSAPAPGSFVVVSKQCTGSIVLRGPPLLPLS